MSDLHPI